MLLSARVFHQILQIFDFWQVAQGAWMAACGRRAAPALRLLLPAWLRAQHDDHAPAAAAARAALQVRFGGFFKKTFQIASRTV